MLLASLMASYLVLRRLNDQYLEGWVSVFVSIWFLGGLTIFCVGLIGIYLSKVFEETKRRPYVTVRAVHRGRDHSP
jgi:putative glycosyltransferase